MYSAAVVIAIASSINACTVTTPTATTTTPATTTAATTPAKTESLPLVVATNSVACALAKQIAGDTIDLKCLIEAGTDPHLYQPKPDDRKAIDSAKLVLYGGYNFEPSLIKLIKASSNTAPKIAVNEVAVPSPLMSEEGHSHDHAHDKEEKKRTLNLIKKLQKKLIPMFGTMLRMASKSLRQLVKA